MTWLNHIRYFHYIRKNWNIRLATKIFGEEVRGERKYRIRTTGANNLESLAQKGIDTQHSTIYMPVSYSLMEKLLGKLPENCRQHFFDYGCGKGRALCLAAHAGFKKVSGVDFSENFCTEARKNLQNTARQIGGCTYEILHRRAEETDLPDDVDCVFLFNPFDEILLEKVLYRIARSMDRNPRKLQLVYVNPIYRTLPEKFGFREEYHTCEMTYLESVVYVAENAVRK